MLRRLLPLAAYVILTRPPGSRAADPVTLREALGPMPRVEVQAAIGAALARAEGLARAEDTILVCGSFYTVGAALQALGLAGSIATSG